MNANELRIGNLVQLKDTKKINEIELIDFVDMYYNKALILLYEPIQLTENWLVNFGLNNGVFLDNEYYSINRLHSNNEFWGLYYEADYTAVDLQYVHQLQNLYFALTGEELTV